MKRLKLTALTLSVLALVILTGCEKEPFDEDCNCGTIVGEGISNSNYYLDVVNECTGNKKRITVFFSTWINGHRGYTQCFSDISNW